MKGTWVRQPDGPAIVVFIHGVLSDGQCWRNENGAYWPDMLAADTRFAAAGIYVFEYKTGYFSGTYRLGDVVNALRTRMRLDGVSDSPKIIFVCHSMGGIVARRFLVQDAFELIDQEKEIGLFLVASPSMESEYANLLSPLTRLFQHTQGLALRAGQANDWLLDLDSDFRKLLNSKRLRIEGHELVEDQFVLLPALIRRQVVQPMSGGRYFGEPYKVPNSNHFTIARPDRPEGDQHGLLVELLEKFIPVPRVKPVSSNSLQFSDHLHGDAVSCGLALNHLFYDDVAPEIVWPVETLSYIERLRIALEQVKNHRDPTSLFGNVGPNDLVVYARDVELSLARIDALLKNAPGRARALVRGMEGYWTLHEKFVATALANFLTLCNYELVASTIHHLRLGRAFERYYPKALADWIAKDRPLVVKELFAIDDEMCWAKLTALSNASFPEGLYFWGPRRDVVASRRQRRFEPIYYRWVRDYAIPQYEVVQAVTGSDQIWAYDEQVTIERARSLEGEDF
ncbi:esterase/lipase family protein [Sphingomonas asaccharolytica]|uniref:esterase/lipase family protein n=1 Tax=Sphingomonas asaccharolytica TaxID=40681 RepID=UPI00082A88C4|nr:alpha/beta hydrolase [Sphingomonas asaccharolytica]